MPWPAIAQSFITIGALVLLWSLHSSLADRPVFRWWAWAWTSYGLNLGAATLAGRLGLDWSFPRATLVLLTAIFGFLTSLFLVFGARSMVSIDLPTRFQRRAGTLLAVAAAVVTVLVSLAWSPANISYHARLAPRTLALAAALFYCAWVFISLWKKNSSPASLITGVVCLVHGLTQGIYGLAIVGNVSDIQIIQPAVDAIISWRWAFFWVELVNVYGSCIGLLLVFAEDYHRAQQALSESLNQRREVTGENLALQQEVETRRRAENALQRSEEKFAAAFRSNPCAMAITLLENGHILDVNDVCIRQSGYRSEELIGKTAEALGIWADQKDRAVRSRRARNAWPRRDARSEVADQGWFSSDRSLLSGHHRDRRAALRTFGRRGHHGPQAGRSHASRGVARAAGLDLRHERERRLPRFSREGSGAARRPAGSVHGQAHPGNPAPGRRRSAREVLRPRHGVRGHGDYRILDRQS